MTNAASKESNNIEHRVDVYTCIYTTHHSDHPVQYECHGGVVGPVEEWRHPVILPCLQPLFQSRETLRIQCSHRLRTHRERRERERERGEGEREEREGERRERRGREREKRGREREERDREREERERERGEGDREREERGEREEAP